MAVNPINKKKTTLGLYSLYSICSYLNEQKIEITMVFWMWYQGNTVLFFRIKKEYVEYHSMHFVHMYILPSDTISVPCYHFSIKV